MLQVESIRNEDDAVWKKSVYEDAPLTLITTWPAAYVTNECIMDDTMTKLMDKKAVRYLGHIL